MHGRMDSDDEESGSAQEEVVPELPETESDVQSDIPLKIGEQWRALSDAQKEVRKKLCSSPILECWIPLA